MSIATLAGTVLAFFAIEFSSNGSGRTISPKTN